jgi:hypothetical protein
MKMARRSSIIILTLVLRVLRINRSLCSINVLGNILRLHAHNNMTPQEGSAAEMSFLTNVAGN